jgi:hypothetical protein
MKRQWPPEVTRAMHQFFDAAPVAPSLTSVYERRPIPLSRRPRRTRVESEEHLVAAKETYVPITDSPTSEIRNRRRLAIAAAAVVAVVGVAAIAVNSMNSYDDVKPAPATATTVAPTTVDPRREAADFIDGVTYTVPDGWKNIGYGVIKGEPLSTTIGVVFGAPGDIYYTSVCPSVSFGAPVGPTVDDLVSAWATLPGVDATAARDVTIDGFHGKQFEFTVPDYDEGDCNGIFSRCSFGGGPLGPTRCDSMLRDKDFSGDQSYAALPNQRQKVMILDVDGSRLVIMAGSFPDTSQQDRVAVDEIVGSIQIDSPAAATTVASTTVESTIVGPTTGTFVMSGVDVTFAVPAGWNYNGWYVANANWSLGVFFDIVANIYTDSCPSVLVDPPVGPTVDDLASAWANLPGFHATAASDITVDGFHGKQIEFTVPDYNETLCSYGDLKLLEAVGGGAYWAQGPNQHHQLWILDVNGTRLVIAATSFPDTSPQDRATLDEILASIQIG